MKTKYYGYLLLGALLLSVGILFMIFSNSLFITAISIGIILSVFGIVLGVIEIARKDRDIRFVLKIILAVICICCGIITAIFNEGSAQILASIFALLLIVDGSFKLNTAAMSKRYDLRIWWLMMIPSVLLIVSGFAIIKFVPDHSPAICIILGALMVIDSVLNILSAFLVPHYQKMMKEDIINEYKYQEKLLNSQQESRATAVPTTNGTHEEEK